MMFSRVEEELHVPTLPEFTPGFSGVRVAQYLVFCIQFSGPYLLFCIFMLAIVLPFRTQLTAYG